MKTFTPKILAYCQARAAGVAVGQAALQAGYLPSSAAVTASRLEPRADVQAEIARIKKANKGKPSADAHAAFGGMEAPPSPLAPWMLKPKYSSSLELMRDVYNNPKAPMGIRIQCAKDALPYEHSRQAQGGKKEKLQDEADKVAGSKKSRFAAQAAPLRRVK